MIVVDVPSIDAGRRRVWDLRQANEAGNPGVVPFICADRWMRNQYGRDLRELISLRYSMDIVVTMHDVDAFEDAVSAYPAVTVVSNKAQGPALVADTTARFGGAQARELVTLGGSRRPPADRHER